jgi:hypothetical protein
MLGCVISIRPPAEISPVLLLGIRVLDEVESRRRKLCAQDRKVEAGDIRLADGCAPSIIC